MQSKNKGKTYLEIYGAEKAEQMLKLRRLSGKSKGFASGKKREKNCKVICKFCLKDFLAADPKSSRCDPCWKCLDCGERVKQLVSRYCGKCRRNHPTDKQKAQLATIHAQTRINNPAKRPEVGRKISEALKKNHPAHSDKHKQKFIEIGRKNIPQKRSKLEELVKPYLADFNYQHKEGFYRIDFAKPSEKIAVEVQGCWHHCCGVCFPQSPQYATQKKTLSNDSRKKTYLLNRGWKIIYIWEHELRKETEQTIKKYVYDS